MFFKWPYFKLAQLWNWKFFWTDDFGILSGLWWFIWDWFCKGGTNLIWNTYDQIDLHWFWMVFVWIVFAFITACLWVIFMLAAAAWLGFAMIYFLLKFCLVLFLPLCWNAIAGIIHLFFIFCTWVTPVVVWIAGGILFVAKWFAAIFLPGMIAAALLSTIYDQYDGINNIWYVWAWIAITATIAIMPIGWFVWHYAVMLLFFFSTSKK